MVANKTVLYDKLKSILGAENVADNEIILDAYMGTTTASAAVGRDRMSEYHLLFILKKSINT